MTTVNSSSIMEDSYENLVYSKICSIVILGTLSFIGGILPVTLFSQKEKSISFVDIALSFFTFFAGGALLCTVFLNLLPEVRLEFVKLAKSYEPFNSSPLPLAETLMCVGFFIMFSIEEVVHILTRAKVHTQCVSIKMNKPQGGEGSSKTDDDFKIEFAENKCLRIEESKSYSSCKNNIDSKHAHLHIPTTSEMTFTGFLMVLALSIHEIFEGMTIGVERHSKMVWYYLSAVLLHKVVLSAIIGVHLTTSKVHSRIAYSYVTFFALTSPLGILLGILLTASSADFASIIGTVSQALACGTLLYVIFFEIFGKNSGKHCASSSLKLVASISGFIFMSAIQIVMK